MNEIEKMYENVEPDRNCNLYKHFTECPMKHTQCEDCENFIYPPFTAEKQLELIKWLSKFNLRIEQPDYAKGYYFIETHTGVYSKFLPIFEEALAGLINDLWQNLTAEERKQIRGILE